MSSVKLPWSLHRFASVTSTMDVAKELLSQNPKGRFSVLAVAQTKGRGRHQRPWISPEGNLFTTLVVPVKDFSTAPFYSYLSALAAHDALSFFVQNSAAVTLKWPNDLLLDSKKMGGILLELEQTEQGMMLFVGIGMNLKYHPEDTPYPATNLSNHKVQVTPEEILPRLLEAFDHWETVLEKEGFEPLRKAWLERGDPAHDAMTLKGYEHGSDTPITGAFHDLDAGGQLILKMKDQAGESVLRKFSAGDVFFS